MSVETTVKRRGWWPLRPVRTRPVRIGVAVWILLAVVGWTAAGVAAAVAAREHQAAGRMAAAAGLTPVSGTGVEIVVSDATGPLAPGENPSLALVQDSDLVFLEMMLWYGGARAVAINGARITAQSAITSAGPTVVIDGRRMVGPFRIVAVGDPRVLRGVLLTRGGFVARMRQSGLGVRITTRQDLTVPAGNSDLAR